MQSIAIDFDNVIHNPDDLSENHIMGKPMPHATEALVMFEKMGYKIYIFTTRAKDEAGKRAVENWLQYFHIPYSVITNIKPQVKYYIDDKAIKFTNWPEVIDKVKTNV